MTRHPDTETLVFRPPRRSLWWLIPLQIALPILFGLLVLRPWPVLMAVTVTAFVALNIVLTYVMRISARTAIEPAGLRVRAGGERLFPWSEIRAADPMPTMMGTVVRVVMTNGFVLALSTPRDGLFGGDRGVRQAVAAIRSRIAAEQAEAAEQPRTGGARDGSA